MKGLLIKDFLTLRSQGRLYLILMVFYFLFGISTKNLSMMGAFLVLISTMLPITCLSYDESCKWDRFALTMPVSRLQMVLSKYLVGLILNLCTLAVVLAANLLAFSFSQAQFSGYATTKDVVLSTLAVCWVGLLIIAVLLPVMFAFGVEKGRYIMMAVFALCFIVPTFLSGVGAQLAAYLPDTAGPLPGWLPPLLMAAALLAVWLLSVALSDRIYRKKEF